MKVVKHITLGKKGSEFGGYKAPWRRCSSLKKFDEKKNHVYRLNLKGRAGKGGEVVGIIIRNMRRERLGTNRVFDEAYKGLGEAA